MLPFITEEIKNDIVKNALENVNAWNKQMIHQIKEKNPEINAAIIEAANNTDFDPKAIALGAFMTYAMLESAEQNENRAIDEILG